MSLKFCRLLLTALAPLALGLTAYAAEGLRVRTDRGELEGKLSDDGELRAFLGIPYAAPPVGPLRWKPPQPPAMQNGVLSVQNYGAHCMQANQFADMIFHDPGASEDCLTLNVWTPRSVPAGAKLPVMVWIYGGGFNAGGTSEARQDGAAFARRGVILVTLNYRLNIFGFFAHPALAAESPQGAAGNYGLMDQAAALAWVKRNIPAFGGDSKNITLFGESAGSLSVSAQMASPLTRDLLAHAIGESGGAFPGGSAPYPSAAKAEAGGQAFARDVLGNATLAQMREMPAETLLKAMASQPAPGVHFGPDVDGLFLPKSVPAIFAAGEQAHIPLLAGWNHDEGGPPNPSITLESYRAGAKKTWGAQASDYLNVYAANNDAEAERSAADYAADRFIAASTWEWIEAQVATGGAPVYRYRFDEPSPGSLYHPAPAAFHSDDIEYVFGNLSARPSSAWTAADYKLSEQMQSYWINFAKTGDPNGPGLPAWPTYNAAGQWPVMHFDATSAAQPDTHRDRYLFLQRAKPQ